MDGSVKLFQCFQTHQQIIGIVPSQSNQNQHSLNMKRAIHLISQAQLLLTSVIFVILEASTMFEYGLAATVIANAISGISYYLLSISHWGNTVKYIECCERFIEKSK